MSHFEVERDVPCRAVTIRTDYGSHDNANRITITDKKWGEFVQFVKAMDEERQRR